MNVFINIYSGNILLVDICIFKSININVDSIYIYFFIKRYIYNYLYMIYVICLGNNRIR